MNDPYKQQRIELCKQQTMLHNTNCDGCEKLRGLYTSLSDRSDMCKACDIGAELREIGKDFMKLVRPRKKLKIITSDKGYEPKKFRNPAVFLEDSKIEEYKQMKLSGMTREEIANQWKVSVWTVKNFAYKHKLTEKSIKGAV